LIIELGRVSIETSAIFEMGSLVNDRHIRPSSIIIGQQLTDWSEPQK
jgi:hypothetical protein